jgi:hypothetical protein
LVTAIYVLYGKPFKRSDVVGKLPSDIVPARFEGLHKSIIGHRDQLYAHTDAKAFASTNHEAANQVRVLVSPTEARLFAILFQARLPVIPKVLELCRALQRKANHNVKKLQKRHHKKVPAQSGEYAVNVLDAAGPFWLKKLPLLSVSKET